MSGAESRYITIDRDDWAALRAATPLTLRQEDLDKLRGINDQIDLDEVAAIYLPLSRLLNLRVSASQDLARVSSTFLGQMAPRVPYVIGVAGSVAVGKSTFARILQALLSRWPDHPHVDLVTTDGFLHPNAVLEERGLMARKGFPESYDTRRLLAFLRDIKSGAAEVRAPVYSHVVYDVLADEETIVRQPDILILEGLNVLQVEQPAPPSSSATTSTSRSTSTPRSPTSSPGSSPASWRCASRCSRTPTASSVTSPCSATTRRARRRRRSGTTSTAATCARTSCRRGSERR